MPADAHAVSSADIKHAIENRDGHMLASMYADNAVMRVIDPSNPPSKPREIKGKTAITQYWDDVCGRTMTHKVEASVADGNRLAFTQACIYPEGGKVFCVAMLELKDGKIVQQPAVQVWDE
jgi:ketosteroid isomerase-like protein